MASSPPANAKIILIDDHPIIIEGLTLLIAPHEEFDVVGHAADAATAQKLLGRKRCDLVVVDLRLPDTHGIELIKYIHKEYPDVRIMVLTMCSEETYGLRAIQAGAQAYIMKDAGPVNIIQAIKKVLTGKQVVSQPLAQALKQAESDVPSSAVELLTDRELSIFELIARGKKQQRNSRASRY